MARWSRVTLPSPQEPGGPQWLSLPEPIPIEIEVSQQARARPATTP
jgi:hypothetical protein